MKQTVKKIRDGLFVGVGFVIAIGITNAVTLISVAPGNSLTDSIWNTMVLQVNTNTSKSFNSVTRTKFNFSNTTPYGVTAGTTLPIYESNSNLAVSGNNVTLKGGNIYLIDMSIRIDGSDTQTNEAVIFSVYESGGGLIETYLSSSGNNPDAWGDYYGTSVLYSPTVDTDIYVNVTYESGIPVELQNDATYLHISEIKLGN